MFRLPIVKFFSRFVNRVTITLMLILVQVGWIASLYLRLTEYAAWLNSVMVVLSVLIILFLVRKDENPAYTIAWMALIGITPVFGGLMYLFWGNKRPSRRMRRRMESVDRRHRGLVAQHPDQVGGLDPRMRELTSYIAKYGPWPAWKETSVQYFSSGEAMFPHLLEDLRHAKRFIFLETFIIRPGRMWNAVEEILREKAAAGVDVRVIYDDMGCLTTVPSGFVVQLERARIRCIPFNPVVPVVSLVMNHRDHRKIVSIDGNIAYNGGTNFADEYINAEERFGYWPSGGQRRMELYRHVPEFLEFFPPHGGGLQRIPAYREGAAGRGGAALCRQPPGRGAAGRERLPGHHRSVPGLCVYFYPLSGHR